MSNIPSQSSPLAQPPHVRFESSDGGSGSSLPSSRSGPRSAGGRTLVPQVSSNGSQTPPTPGTPGFYASTAASNMAASSERLLPPSRSRAHPPSDGQHFHEGYPEMSVVSSRRNSYDSESASRDSRMVYSPNPFEDSRPGSRAGSDDDNVNTQTVSEKYNILPSAGLLLFPEDVEGDDYLHNPDPNEKDKRDCDIFSRRGVVNLGGLLIIGAGILMLVVGYPVATLIGRTKAIHDPCLNNANCIKGVGQVPLLKNVRSGLIDPDTPDSAKTKIAADGKTKLNLVFSDEFNTNGRTFYPGDDPYWEAVDLWYGVTRDLEWYDPDAVTTKDGVLELRFDAFQNHGLNYRSGMLQSWNKMCFTGGLLEASISLPGRGDTVGFWPGFWSMGNLGRPGYAATTEGMWPYSYDNVCDPGITANQSSSDGISYLPGMKMPACTCDDQDHPNPGKSRSAPEIDVLEASVAAIDKKNMVGQVSQSCQIAPFDIWYYPDYDYFELYDPSVTTINSYTGGPYQQAISGLSFLNNDWYDGKVYQTYSFDYSPGKEGEITWYIGPDKTYKLDARALRPNGNVGQRTIPAEPMSMILNFGMSSGFSSLNFTGLGATLPATMRIDYVRIYQDPNSENLGCDPEDYPTTEYIRNHPDVYTNTNLTSWSKTDYKWPKNALVHGCSAADSSVPIRRS